MATPPAPGTLPSALAADIGVVDFDPRSGGKVSYFPLPELTMSASLDQTIGTTLLAASPTSPLGTSTQGSSFLAQANYALAPEWTLAGQGGLALTTYGGINRRDTAWTAALNVTYKVWQNFGLTSQIQRTVLDSNVPQTAFTNNVVSLGVSYVY